ncbi:Fasciclin-like arabinogalactan protein 11 [Ancistrocladus abbreviatus]
MKQPSLLLFLLLETFFAMVIAQAPAPAPAGPTNITAILAKAGQFNTFIRLLQSTQIDNQINNQLNNSNSGLTVFAPTDNAFANLKSGSLNSFTDQQKVALVQFHILPSFLSIPQLQTASNPLRTLAGNSNDGEFPLNVTTSGNQVNITTGVVNTTVSNTIYSDNQLAVYQVDQALLPLEFFTTPSPAPAPAPSKPTKSAKPSDDLNDSGKGATSDSPDGTRNLIHHAGMNKVLFGVFVVGVPCMLL